MAFAFGIEEGWADWIHDHGIIGEELQPLFFVAGRDQAI